MTVSEAVTALLTGHLSKSKLSSRSGVSRSLIDDYLHGRRQPSVAQLERLGAAAGLRLELTWREGERKHVPDWARPNAKMAARPLTMDERAQILERVTAAALSLPRRSPTELTFPPFRSVARQIGARWPDNRRGAGGR
jgi:transcriptional regulator with XRE-family HTH domain